MNQEKRELEELLHKCDEEDKRLKQLLRNNNRKRMNVCSALIILDKYKGE